MISQLKYDKMFAGAKAIAQNDSAAAMTNINGDDRLWHRASKGSYAICTGYYYEDSGYYYPQTTNGWYLIANTENPNWLFYENAAKIGSYSQSQAQALVNKIIKCNIQIVQNNLICARYANKFNKEQQQQIRDLQNRVIERENALKEQGLCTDVQTSYPAGYAELAPYMDRLMNSNGVGIATWAVVVIAAVVIASLSTAAYFAYKYYASEAEKDVKYSKELTKILTEKLTPEEYQQLLSETKGIVTKARIMQSIGGLSKYLLIGGAVVGGALLYRLIKNKG